MSEAKQFTEAIEEHGSEGIEILMGSSSILAHGVIYIITGLLVSIFVWSFFAKADVIITCKGKLEPRSEMKRIYAPAAGDLIDMNVAVGMSVSRNDLLARIKSADAIRASASATKAEIQFEEAKLEKEIFPEKKKLLEKEIDNIKEQIQKKNNEMRIIKEKGLSNLDATLSNKLKNIGSQYVEAENEMNAAKNDYERYRRLYNSEDHGGITKKDLEERESRYIKAKALCQRLRLEREGAEIEISKQKTEAGTKIDQTYIELLELRVKLKNKEMEYATAEKQINMKYESALIEKESSSVVTSDDLDTEGFLKIRSPVDGDITHVASTQRGEKIRAEDALFHIAPANTEKILIINVPDKDCGMLKPGLSVKLKFSAFPYQSYGFINGILESISSSARPSKEGEQKDEKSLYEGRISLELDYFTVDGKKIILRYGMTADAEIVVQKRRMIDLVLDPFKKIRR